MKTTILVLILSISSAFSQVDCGEQNPTFSGECEAYNTVTGIRSTYNYKKGKLHGEFVESYENGQIRSKGNYKGGFLHGKFSAFYVTGEKMTVAKFKSGTGSFTMYHTNGAEKVKGQFKEGKGIDTWSHYDSNGDLTNTSDGENIRTEMYAFLVGERIVTSQIGFDNFFDSFGGDGFSFSFDGNSDSTFSRMREELNEAMKELETQMESMMQSFSDSSLTRSFHFDTTFSSEGFGDFDQFFEFKSFGDSSFSKSFHFDTIIGEMPQRSNPFFNSPDRDLVDFPDTEPLFICGDEAMKSFIQSEMHILEEKNEKSKKGTVFIEAIVEVDGSISNSRVALGVDSLRDTEALRIIRSMPLWKPASLDGQPVRSRCIIPVEFGRD